MLGIKIRVFQLFHLCLQRLFWTGLFFVVAFFIVGCSFTPKVADGIENSCRILKTHSSWEKAFIKAYQDYGVPPHVIMAIIYQESRYVYDARPPKKTFLGIPTVRPSTAYGFAQALDETWDWYIEKSGNSGADRDNLPDAVDFVGWYINENVKRTGTSKWDAKSQYLAYHEGTGGYLKKTYNSKPWLIKVSAKVAAHAAQYRSQLVQCYQYPK